MHGKRVVHLSLLVGMVAVTACQGQSDGAAQGQPQAEARRIAPSLAKAKISEAGVAAKQWKPDAVLIQVAASGVGEDGMHVLWDYGFYSAAAKTCLVVNVAGTTTTRESGGQICESAELKEFI